MNIQIDMTRLRVRDIDALNRASKNNLEGNEFSLMIPILARLCNITEDEVWDWDIPTLNQVITVVNDSMNSTVKKTNGGS